MDISGLRSKRKVWVPYLDGLELLVEYLPRDELLELSEKAVVAKFDEETKKETETFDKRLCEKLICQQVVKGWREVTVAADGSETYGDAFVDGDQPFNCTTENVGLLAEKLSGFALYINKVCVDLQALNAAKKEQAEKN